MKRLRRHPLILAAIALALPLGVAFLYYDFYDRSDLVCRAQLSIADNEDLLNFLRKNPRVLVAADESFLSAGTHLHDMKCAHSVHPASTTQTSSVLRC
jgi:hypothetical protein